MYKYKLRHILLANYFGYTFITLKKDADKKTFIIVNDKMQKGYKYVLSAPIGMDFDFRFKPDLTPKEMLRLGIFGGRYMRDCRDEFPKDWFLEVRLHPEGLKGHSPELNFFAVDASQPIDVWRKKGWIDEEHDPRGWFQWYCRYYMGRRIESEDDRQIKRWLAIGRHIAQIKKNCRPGDLFCRRKQRQAVLHWAYDSRKI